MLAARSRASGPGSAGRGKVNMVGSAARSRAVGYTLGGLLWALVLLSPGLAGASVVSRIGHIFFYDPLTFDAGILQRSMMVRGGVDTDQGRVDAALDLPFYRELGLRVGYLQGFRLGDVDTRDLSIRLRMPVIESARFGRISSAQFVYAASFGVGDASDGLLPNHQVGVADSIGRSGRNAAHSLHSQLLLNVRDAEKVGGAAEAPWEPLGRVGVEARFAHLMQPYRPQAGLGGSWTATISSAEVDVVHYGGRVSQGGVGRVEMTAAAPALHFTPSYATYTLGVMPRLVVAWGAEGTVVDLGAFATFSISYRTYLE